jgi:hypothetical protein
VFADRGPELERAEALLQILLQDLPSAVPFGIGVLRHLCSPGARGDRPPAELAAEIAGYFREPEGVNQPDRVRRLCSDPKLLASFFQNGDLLPAGSPEAGHVGRLVMEALERLQLNERT